jgi:hypothetical protein
MAIPNSARRMKFFAGKHESALTFGGLGENFSARSMTKIFWRKHRG